MVDQVVRGKCRGQDHHQEQAPGLRLGGQPVRVARHPAIDPGEGTEDHEHHQIQPVDGQQTEERDEDPHGRAQRDPVVVVAPGPASAGFRTFVAHGFLWSLGLRYFVVPEPLPGMRAEIGTHGFTLLLRARRCPVL